MSDHVYGITEVAGSSTSSIDDAIRNAVSTAGKSVRNLNWLEVKEIRGHIDNAQVSHFQVVVKLGFRYDK